MVQDPTKNGLERYEVGVFDRAIYEVKGRVHLTEMSEEEKVSLAKPLAQRPLLKVNQIDIV